MRARRQAIFFLILLVTSSFSLFLGEIPVAEGAGENWLAGFTYRKAISINGSTVQQTNYQVPLPFNVYQEFEFGAVTNFNGSGHQGVATDGTHVYSFTAGSGLVENIISKHLQDGTFVQDRDVNGDGWTGDDATGDLGGGCVVGDFIYITTHVGVAQGYVVNYSKADLSYNGEFEIKSGIGQACSDLAYYAPTEKFFLMGGNNIRQVGVYNSSFGYETKYDISDFPVTGTYKSYEGISFYGDYFFATIHEGSSPEMVDVWYFTGSDCEPVVRMDRVEFTPTYGGTATCTQGLDVEEKGGDWFIWWASRGVQIHTNVARTPLTELSTGAYGLYCNSDFSDIRFTTSDGSTEFDHWPEETDLSTIKIWWMEIPTIPTGGTTVYLYYENTTTVNLTWDGDATFPLLFDNFTSLDAGTWTWDGASVAGGICTIAVGSKYIRTDDIFAYDSEIALRSEVEIAGNRRWNQGFGENFPTTEDYAELQNQDGNINAILKNDASSTGQQLITTYAGGVYVKTEVRLIEVSDECEGVWNETAGSAIAGASYPDENMYAGFQTWGSSDNGLEIDWCFIRKYVDPEPIVDSVGIEETYVANTAPVLGGYTISDWDGDALYTDGEFSNWWLQATDADGGSDISTFECAFLLGSDWCNFTFTSSTGLWVKDTDCPITIQNDGQSAIGTVKNALGILAIEDGAEPTENVVVYGRVTDASSATSGWGVLPGVGFSVREPGSSGDTGGYSEPGDDDEDDDEVDEEPIPECWMMDVDNLNSMSVDALRVLADILGLPYTEDTLKAELVEAIYTEAVRLCEEGETPFSGCLMDEEEKLAKLDYLMGLSVQELRLECQSLGISYLLWRDPEPYIILIFTVGYHCSPPGDFDPEDWDGDGTENWEDPDMFDETRMGMGARIEDIHLEESLPWLKGNGYVLIILLLVFAFFYSQVKKKDKPGSRGESLIRPRQGGYLPGERSKK